VPCGITVTASGSAEPEVCVTSTLRGALETTTLEPSLATSVMESIVNAKDRTRSDGESVTLISAAEVPLGGGVYIVPEPYPQEVQSVADARAAVKIAF
jgi:hypothetical protein